MFRFTHTVIITRDSDIVAVGGANGAAAAQLLKSKRASTDFAKKLGPNRVCLCALVCDSASLKKGA